MPIAAARAALLVVVAIVLATGCSAEPASSGGLDRLTGCSSVVAERLAVGTQVVMDVRATDCRDANGRPLESHTAVERVEQAVWRSLDLPVDAIRVHFARSAAQPATPTMSTADDLSGRFGRGPHGVVWSVSDEPDEGIWVLLPTAYLAIALTMLLVVGRLRRAGVVIVLLRR